MPSKNIDLSAPAAPTKPRPRSKSPMRDKIKSNSTPQKAAATPRPVHQTSSPSGAADGVFNEEDFPLRKEIRVSEEMNASLSALRRRLNAARKEHGATTPSITDRMLVRAALRILLEHGNDITGFSEGELLESLRSLASGH